MTWQPCASPWLPHPLCERAQPSAQGRGLQGPGAHTQEEVRPPAAGPLEARVRVLGGGGPWTLGSMTEKQAPRAGLRLGAPVLPRVPGWVP